MPSSGFHLVGSLPVIAASRASRSRPDSGSSCNNGDEAPSAGQAAHGTLDMFRMSSHSSRRRGSARRWRDVVIICPESPPCRPCSLSVICLVEGRAGFGPPTVGVGLILCFRSQAHDCDKLNTRHRYNQPFITVRLNGYPSSQGPKRRERRSSRRGRSGGGPAC